MNDLRRQCLPGPVLVLVASNTTGENINSDMIKTITISTRIDDSLRERLRKVANETGIEEATILRESAKAAIRYVETHGHLVFPLTVIPFKRKGAPATVTEEVSNNQN